MYNNNLGRYVLTVANGYGEWKIDLHPRKREIAGMLKPAVFVREVGHEQKRKQIIGHTTFKLSPGATIWILPQEANRKGPFVRNLKLVVVPYNVEEEEVDMVASVDDVRNARTSITPWASTE